MTDLFNIEDKKIIITGGSGGLGFDITKELLKSGAEVLIIDISKNLEKSVNELSKYGKIHGINADISTHDGRVSAFSEALSVLGGHLDVLINCAGIQKRHFSEEFPLEDWQKVIDINLTAVFELCSLAGQTMLKQGQGKIINFASMLSFFGGYTVPAYAASKGGVAQLTKALSNEWAKKGIQVNAIAPGYMATTMNTAIMNDEKRNEQILSRIPAGRWGTGEDAAGLIIFLSSKASDYINGAVIPVDGGYLGC